jgi:hypothetical protein
VLNNALTMFAAWCGMFPIDPRATIRPALQPASRPSSGTGARFALPGGQPEAARVATTSAAMPMDALFALQATESATERKKRRVKRGHDLLEGLDRLKAALLAGVVPAGQLQSLKAQLEARAEISDDPRLEEIVEHIELRVAVELAKLKR